VIGLAADPYRWCRPHSRCRDFSRLGGSPTERTKRNRFSICASGRVRGRSTIQPDPRDSSDHICVNTQISANFPPADLIHLDRPATQPRDSQISWGFEVLIELKDRMEFP
jgi:hypothetical protein